MADMTQRPLWEFFAGSRDETKGQTAPSYARRRDLASSLTPWREILLLVVIPGSSRGSPIHPCWFVSNNNGSPRGEGRMVLRGSRLGAHGMVQAYLLRGVSRLHPTTGLLFVHQQSKEVVRGSIYSPCLAKYRFV